MISGLFNSDMTTLFVMNADQVGKKNQSLCANKYLLCGISAFVLMCVPF